MFLNAEVAPVARPPAGRQRAERHRQPGEPGTLYGDRRNQLDLRLTKNFKIQQLRTGVNFELYNLFNTNTVLTENTTYRDATIPAGASRPRLRRRGFMKFSVQLDF